MLVQDLIREVVNSMVVTLDVYYVLPVSGGYELRTLNTQYINANMVINLDGTDYTVTSFELNKSITVSANTAPTAKKYDLANPSYFHGKLKQTNAELARAGRVYPLIWLFELAPRTKPQEVDTIFQSTGSARLFFMNSANYSDFTTEDHYREVINPVNNLVKAFMSALKKHRLVKNVFVNNLVGHAKFSNDTGETDSNGNNILPAQLSGIELDLELPIRKDYTCPEKDLPVPTGGEFDQSFDQTQFKVS